MKCLKWLHGLGLQGASLETTNHMLAYVRDDGIKGVPERMNKEILLECPVGPVHLYIPSSARRSDFCQIW